MTKKLYDQPIPNVHRASVLNQEKFKDSLVFITDSEWIQNEFWFSLIHTKIQKFLNISTENKKERRSEKKFFAASAMKILINLSVFPPFLQ